MKVEITICRYMDTVIQPYQKCSETEESCDVNPNRDVSNFGENYNSLWSKFLTSSGTIGKVDVSPQSPHQLVLENENCKVICLDFYL